LEIVGAGDGFLGNLDDHISWRQSLVCRGRTGIDAGDDDTFHAILDLVAPAQIFGKIGKLDSKRLLYYRLVRGGIVLAVRRGELLAVLQTAERDDLGFLAALADDHYRRLFADWRIGHHSRQITHFLDIPAVELYDDIAWLYAGRLGRTFVVHTGDQ